MAEFKFSIFEQQGAREKCLRGCKALFIYVFEMLLGFFLFLLKGDCIESLMFQVKLLQMEENTLISMTGDCKDPQLKSNIDMDIMSWSQRSSK